MTEADKHFFDRLDVIMSDPAPTAALIVDAWHKSVEIAVAEAVKAKDDKIKAYHKEHLYDFAGADKDLFTEAINEFITPTKEVEQKDTRRICKCPMPTIPAQGSTCGRCEMPIVVI